MALLDVQVAALANQALNYLASGNNPVRYGNAHPNIVPYQAFQTSDSHIILAVGNDAQFERFCEIADRPDLAADERFRNNSGRVSNREILLPQVIDIMRLRSSADWLELLNARGIPCGPINNLDEVFADPQVRHRGLQIELEHPTAGSVPGVANPIRFSQTPLEFERAPPLLGQDTRAVLQRLLGLDGVTLDELQGQAVIA
jgi:crotonobetainyl-CoA:carnitine CoA-transferase CaiB-like acyl-CoA transferase